VDTLERVRVADTRETTDSGRPAQVQRNFKNLCAPGGRARRRPIPAQRTVTVSFMFGWKVQAKA